MYYQKVILNLALVFSVLVGMEPAFSQNRNRSAQRRNLRQQRQARPRRTPTQGYQFEVGSSYADYERFKRKMEAERREREANQIPLEVRAVDAQDQEVPVLVYGTHVLHNDDHLADNPLRGAGVSTETLKIRDGEVRGTSGSGSTYGHKPTRLYILRTQAQAPLYVLSADRQLAGLREITPADAQAPITVRMGPVCRVTGVVTCSELIQRDRLLPYVQVDVRWKDHQPVTYHMPIERPTLWEPHKLGPGADRYAFSCYLPPGNYSLDIQAHGDTLPQRLSVAVNPGQTQLDLGLIDLAPASMVALEGRPAPELTPNSNWIHGKPVTLAQLRGRPVVLYFTDEFKLAPQGARGGTYRSTPEQVRIGSSAGGYAAGGGSAGFVAEDDTQLQRIVEDFQQDRVELIAFCRTLDSKTQSLAGLRFRVAHCPADAGQPTVMSLYHVTSFPSTIIIDQQGRVAAAFSRRPNAEDIEQVLNTKAGWRDEFDRLYTLQRGQRLKLISQPFCAARGRYWYAHPYGITASALPEKAVYAWKDGGVVLESDWSGFVNVVSHVLDNIPIKDHARMQGLLRVHFKGGDWVYCPETPLADRVKALERLLPRHMGMPVELAMQPVHAGNIRVSGRFHYQPLQPDNKDGVVHAFIGTDIPEPSSPRTDSLDQLFMDITRYFDQTLLLERPRDESLQIQYCLHPGLDRIKLSSQDGQADLLAQLFDNIAKQTGLTFDYDPEPQNQLLISAPTWERQFGPPDLWGRQ